MVSFNFGLLATFLWLLSLADTGRCAIFILTDNQPITRFKSTMTVPSPPTTLQTGGKVQCFWPALEPTDGSSILQNVVANEGSTLGNWYFIPYFLDPAAPAGVPQIIRNLLDPAPQVYPGDVITTEFKLDESTGNWLDSWSLKPGAQGQAAGQKAFSGSGTFDLHPYTEIKKFEMALLNIEVYGNGVKWDSGDLHFNNVEVEIDGSDANWCDSAHWLVQGSIELETPAFSRVSSDGKVTCYVPQVTITQ